MTTFASKLKQLRWFQWLLLAVVFIYVLYVALSYLYLPNKLKQVVEEDVAELLGRTLTVEPIEFNPFDLSVRVKQFSIADKPGAPLVAWQEFYANFTPWGSLFSWDIKFEALELDQPIVNIEKQGERFNFSDILDQFESEEPALETEEEPTKIALEILLTHINNGQFRYTDLSGETPASTEMDDITIEIKDIYLATGDEHLNPFDIKASIPGGGDLQLKGEYRIDPLYVDAQVDAQGVQLKEYSDFVTNVVPLYVNDGVLSLNTKVLVQQDDEFELKISNGQIKVISLAVDDKIVDPAMIRIQNIDINDVELDLLAQSVVVGSVSMNDVVGNQWIDEKGQPRFQHVLVEEVVEKNIEQHQQQKNPQPVVDETSEPWAVVVEKVSFDNGQINFSDQNDKITKGHSISSIAIYLENVTLEEGEQVPLKISGLLDDSGEIEVEGAITLLPFSMDLQYQLDNLQLPAFSEYVELASHMRIEKGGVNIEGSVKLSTEGEVPISSQLELEINGFQAEDMRTGKPILQFKQIKIADAKLDTQSKRFNVASLTMSEPDLLLTRSKQAEMNWATLAKTEKLEEVVEGAGEKVAEELSDESKADDSQEWQYSIGAVKLENGMARFVDKSVKPNFKAGLFNLEVVLEEVASDKTTPTPFSIETKIDRYAPFSVKGKMDPVAQQPGFEFRSELKGLEMHRLSPYSAEFVAHNLESGKLSLDLEYSLHNSELDGDNAILAKNLYLGDKVPNENAIDAPVALGLALLRDTNGVIDLDVGVSGDLDDPGFSVSGIILKAFVNVIVKAASSPFSLLGSLVGGREDLGEIEFAPGFAELTEDNKERLQQLVEALKQRPQLSIHIQGNALDAEDVEVLQKLVIQDIVAEKRKMSLEELREEAGEKDWWTVRANRRQLDDINESLSLTDSSDREDQLEAEQPELDGDKLEELVYKAIYADVSAQQKIETRDVLELADRRALTIKQHLVDVLGFDFQRVSVTKTKKDQMISRTISLEIEAK